MQTSAMLKKYIKSYKLSIFLIIFWLLLFRRRDNNMEMGVLKKEFFKEKN